MAIVFNYTESTNKVVQTGGTSEVPATFADFVTADRAGTNTKLLDAGSPASDLALTYPVRPVEDLAILVKCVVANKTAETDYIFITGKDWRGAAQTESIDVSAGNGSYTTTKYWSEITTLDCSDNAAGGGTVWADGDLTVTQDIWGVIWDYGGGQYQLDANWNIGDNSTSTYFTSKNESFHLSDTYKIIVRTSAHLTIGELSGSWGINGSYWSVAPTGSMNLGDWTASDVKIYASHLHIRNNSYILFRLTSTTYIKNSILSSEGNGYFFFNTQITGIVDLQSVYINNVVNGLYPANLPDVCNDVHVHKATHGIMSNTPGVQVQNADFTTIAIADAYTMAAGSTLELIDPKTHVSSPRNNQADNWIKEQYTCNIHIVDKGGANINGVTVACEDQFGTPVFSVSTGADGKITEQTITYKKWEGTSETLTTYSPHKFTISKAGYETLVLESITVDGPIDWHLELQDSGSIRPRFRIHGD